MIVVRHIHTFSYITTYSLLRSVTAVVVLLVSQPEKYLPLSHRADSNVLIFSLTPQRTAVLVKLQLLGLVSGDEIKSIML